MPLPVVEQALRFGVVRPSVRKYDRPVNTQFHKPLGRISPDLQLWCFWEERRTDYISRSKGQRSSVVKNHLGAMFSTQNVNPFNARCSKLLLFEGFSTTLV